MTLMLIALLPYEVAIVVSVLIYDWLEAKRCRH